MMDIIDRLAKDQPAFHVGGAVRWDSLPETLRFIRAYAQSGMTTLETGCGVSTVVFAAQGTNHTTISPDRREHDLVREYCERVGIGVERVRFVEGLSDIVLPHERVEREVDLAFIDGAHAFPYPVVDWHYVVRALKIGGRLILDDIPIPSVAAAYRFMRTEPCWRLDEILDKRTAAFSLVTEPQPEDWTLQAFNAKPDYSFLPLRERISSRFNDTYRRTRRTLGDRFPGLRRTFGKSHSGS